MIVIALLFACQSSSVCRSHTDCASGICMANGLCESVETNDTAAPALPPEEPAAETPEEVPAEDTSDRCSPNHDGEIVSAEYPNQLETSVPFALSTGSPIELDGGASAEWDFSTLSNDSEEIDVIAETLADQWFADTFPSSSYAAVLSYQQETMGIFTRTEDVLYLDGIASFEGGWFETLLTLDPPAAILVFPLAEGDLWSTDTIVSGTIDGVLTYYEESYTSEASARGSVQTPRGRFPSLRVDTHIERTIALLQYENRSTIFVSECYGTIVSASSELDETDRNFTIADQLLVITP